MAAVSVHAQELQTVQQLLENIRASKETLREYSSSVVYEGTTQRSGKAPRYLRMEIGLFADYDASRLSLSTKQFEASTGNAEKAKLVVSNRQTWGDSTEIGFTPAEGQNQIAVGTRRNDGEAVRRHVGPSQGGELLSGTFFDVLPAHEIVSTEGDGRILEEMEVIDGVPCFVLKGGGKYGKITLWVDPQHDYVIRKAMVEKDGGHIGGIANQPIGELPGFPQTAFEFVFGEVEVEEIDGMHFVTKGRIQTVWTSVNGESYTTDLTVALQNFQPNRILDASAFAPEIPDGTKMIDKDFPAIEYEWEKGNLIPTLDTQELRALDRAVQELATDNSEVGANARVSESSPPLSNDFESGDSYSVVLVGLVIFIVIAVLAGAAIVHRSRRR